LTDKHLSKRPDAPTAQFRWNVEAITAHVNGLAAKGTHYRRVNVVILIDALLQRSKLPFDEIPDYILD
jgi:hypothetical protein